MRSRRRQEGEWRWLEADGGKGRRGCKQHATRDSDSLASLARVAVVAGQWQCGGSEPNKRGLQRERHGAGNAAIHSLSQMKENCEK